MKIPTFILGILCIFCSLVLKAQDPLIIANPSQGCDSLTVNFSFASSLLIVTSENWKFGDGTNSNVHFPSKKYNKPGSYTVSLKLNGTDSSTTIINVGKTPNRDSLNLHVNYRDTSILGSPVKVVNEVIEVTYNNNHPFPYTYQWYIEGMAMSTNRSFYHQFDSVGLYHVSLRMTDVAGCTALFIDSVNLTPDIIVPNVFTPNDDLVNDDFIVKYNGQDILSLQIYTRTGLLIYKAEAKTIVWDGRLPSGDKVLPGIYYYVVETIKTPSVKKKSGFVYIFR